jgi:hypothetical protein
LSLFDRPDVIGPAGTNTVGRWPKCSAPISRPGTILSHTPSINAPSNMSCDKAIAVAIAITSREYRLSSMPAVPCVTPSHIAGTPPATCAVAPSRRASALISPGNAAGRMRRQHVVEGVDDADVGRGTGRPRSQLVDAGQVSLPSGGAALGDALGDCLNGGFHAGEGL